MRLNALLFVVAIVVPGLVHAHGLPVNLEADASLKLRGAEKFFWGADATFKAFDVTQQRFQAGIGVHDLSAGIAAGTVLSVNATGDSSAIGPDYAGQALVYWNGSEIAPTSQTLKITRSSTTVLVDGDDTFVTGPLIGTYSGDDEWHGTTNFFLPLDAPAGLYAIGLQVTAPGHTASDTFWVIANVGMSNEDYARGVAAIAAAVPEPASIVMAAMGLIAACALGIRRSR